MDIQGYIIDHWLSRTSAEHPVLIIYDKSGWYYDLLPLLEERKVKIIDTTKAHLHARLAAQRYWCKELSMNSDARMVICLSILCVMRSSEIGSTKTDEVQLGKLRSPEKV